MALMVLAANSPTRNKWVFFSAVVIAFVAPVLLLTQSVNTALVVLSLWIYFCGFNTLEALLPSLVSRLAPAAGKGSAMGVYNTFQFMGVFFGGLLGGVIYGSLGVNAVFVTVALVLSLWAFTSYTVRPFRLLDSLTVRIKPEALSACRDAFSAIEGVEEVMVFEDEQVAYLKIDKQALDQTALDALIRQ